MTVVCLQSTDATNNFGNWGALPLVILNSGVVQTTPLTRETGMHELGSWAHFHIWLTLLRFDAYTSHFGRRLAKRQRWVRRTAPGYSYNPPRTSLRMFPL
jgi:hypothetical protein